MSLYDLPVEDLRGLETTLEEYRDQVLLIVNVASKCGYTPQLAGLEDLYKTYKDKGFTILGFPCNQFLRQAPGTNTEIADFCMSNYGVTFPIFGKLNVKGRNISPLYDYLIHTSPERTGKKVKWNFEKFLINKNGVVIHRYDPNVTPEELVPDLEVLLP
jgi:glutathione peroxidase